MVTALENGDVACYLTLKDDQGVVFKELGDFDLCTRQPSLIGKRVALKYSVENVMADECQGNPDCKKTRTVALVASVQVLGSPAASKTAPAVTQAQSGSQQTSFCTPLEVVVFACRTGAKLVSVCASKDASPTRGYLQYRFGKPDSMDPIEITLPVGEPVPPKAASGENVPFAGGGGSWLRFRNGPFGYVVYTGIGKWGPHGETMEKQGIVVERSGKTVANLPCSGTLTSELGPEWFEQVGVKTDDEDFLFPDPPAAKGPSPASPARTPQI
ncbi:MAG: hypothetical protein NTY02_20265 [Acidobacteria bacterium]|nr:hypothetical protein [Acidobacteriota bacterium]